MLGRIGIGVDVGTDYAQAATWRANDPKERARAAGRTPDQVATIGRPIPGQLSVLDLAEEVT
jgi:hypothetical protein